MVVCQVVAVAAAPDNQGDARASRTTWPTLAVTAQDRGMPAVPNLGGPSSGSAQTRASPAGYVTAGLRHSGATVMDVDAPLHRAPPRPTATAQRRTATNASATHTQVHLSTALPSIPGVRRDQARYPIRGTGHPSGLRKWHTSISPVAHACAWTGWLVLTGACGLPLLRHRHWRKSGPPRVCGRRRGGLP